MLCWVYLLVLDICMDHLVSFKYFDVKLIRIFKVCGMLVALQFWFWFPLSHFLSLAFRPSALICLNGNLDLPKIEITSNAKPAKFAYPPMTEEKKGKEKQKVETAVLSITVKAKARQRAKKVDCRFSAT